MKKIWFILIALFTLLYTKNVYAFSLGVSNVEGYDGVSFLGTDNGFVTKGGVNTTVVVNYESFDRSDSDVQRIEVKLNLGSGMSVVSSSVSNPTETLSGSSPNYTINFSETPDVDGTALFTIMLPSPGATTEVNLSATATAYNKSGGVIETQTTGASYLILVKDTSCDDNSSISVTTSAGAPKNIGSLIGDNFAISTNAATIDINVTPASSKSIVRYAKESIFTDNLPILSGGVIKEAKLEYGENNFSFIVEDECYQQWQTTSQNVMGRFMLSLNLEEFQRSPYIYNLIVTRNDTRSKVNTLKSLTISDAKINFNPNLKTYMATVPNEVTSVKISSSLSDVKSTYVNGYGNRTVNLKEGVNDILIKVRAENGAEAVYTIKITREVSDNANLKKLVVNKKEILLKKNTLIYSTLVGNNVTKVDIVAEPENETSKVEIPKIEELKEGNNKISITVTAPSGKKNIYVLTVVRDKLISENSKLKSLKIANHEIDFHNDQFEYTITKTKQEKQLDIEVVTEHEKATYMIVGNKNLKDGSTIKIKVTAQDKKTTSTYLIHIKEEKSSNILLPIIIGIVVIGGIGFVIFKKTKKKKKLAHLPDEKDDKPLVEETTQPETTPETTPVSTPSEESLPKEENNLYNNNHTPREW